MNEYEIKARELVDRFLDIDIPYKYNGSDQSMSIPYNEAKQCAILCVAEILNLNINEWCQISEPYQDYDYWEKVKQTINELH